MKRALTIKSVTALQKTDNEYEVWCGDVPGFGVRVSSNGYKSFMFRYRFLARNRRMALGRFGDVTVDQARKEAESARGLLAKSIDPQTARDEARQSTCLDDAWERFVEVNRKSWSENTLAEYERTFKLHIRPALGNRAIKEIDRPAVAALHHKMRNKPTGANKAVAVLGSFLTHCKREGLTTGDNPCTTIRRYEERPRERVLNEAEIAALGEAIENYQGDVYARAAIRLIILLGCRKMEILKMRWEEIDLFAGSVRLPETKTGARTVYLGEEAVEILKCLPRRPILPEGHLATGKAPELNPYVIAGDKPGAHRADLKKPWAAILKAAGIEGATIHDLRRTYGSAAVSTGADIYMVSKLLGHSSVKMTERAYAFMADETRLAAAKVISERMSANLAGKGVKVVKLKAVK
jgi:integrase